MTLSYWLVVKVFHLITSALARIHSSELIKVPDHGPLIIATNHVNILEIPILFSRLQPRPITSFVAAERWESGWGRWLMNVTGAIPLQRGEADLAALRKGIRSLTEGKILILAPEGTRSHNGRLQEGKPGIVILALKSGVPILPVVFYGGEGWVEKVQRFQRSDFRIVVGKPFKIQAQISVTKEVRQKITDEIMYQLARLLPEKYRGVYANLEAGTTAYLTFEAEDQ